MSKILSDLFYSSTHEWARVEGNEAYIGITDYAQSSLGSVVYVECREIGDTVKQGEECGAIESVKAASDLMSPLSGTVLEVNQDVIDNPELLNTNPYDNWIFKISIDDENEVENLLTAEKYTKEIEE